MNLNRFFERNKFLYYIKNIILDILPRAIFRYYLNYWKKQQYRYPSTLIKERVGYYCKLQKASISKESVSLKNLKKKGNKSMYYYDFMQIARYFSPTLKVLCLFGDVDKKLEKPTFVKSRPILNNENSVILKLNKLRHFNFLNDTKNFKEKKNKVIWRGVIHKENRKLLFEKHFNNVNFDIGATRSKNSKSEWIKPLLTIDEQLKNKFILSLEGNDVATNLKWIMSSNSLCFMPKPKFETWFMEGKLIPNFHYILIKDDYSDVEQKMKYYAKNIEESEKILANAKQWLKQFQDKKLEKIISILTIEKYSIETNQH